MASGNTLLIGIGGSGLQLAEQITRDSNDRVVQTPELIVIFRWADSASALLCQIESMSRTHGALVTASPRKGPDAASAPATM